MLALRKRPRSHAEHDGDATALHVPAAHAAQRVAAASLDVPAAHGGQYACPGSGWCVPGAHSAQTVAPGSPENFEAGHAPRHPLPGAPAMALPQRPTVQLEQRAAPPSLYVPPGQGVHCVRSADSGRLRSAENVATGHSLHVAAPSVAPNLPPGHAPHAPADAAPGNAANVPMTHAWHAVLPWVSCHWPAGHSRQAAWPPEGWCLPAGQGFCAPSVHA